MASLQTRSSEPVGRFMAAPGESTPDFPRTSFTYWPVGPLQAFTLRMASHGLCVSSAMMLGDRRYAQDQLAYAHSFDDDTLKELALMLFQHFAAQHDSWAGWGGKSADRQEVI